MPRPESAGKARTYAIFGLIVFGVIMVPSAIMVGCITYMLSNLSMLVGDTSYGLISLVHIISAFTMIFCMPVMFNVLYFARDIGFLSSMPIRPVHLYTAKFWHTYRTENFMTAFTLLAMFIGWFVAFLKNFGWGSVNPITIISAITALFAIPALPLIYCSILSTILMVVLRKVRKMSIFYHSSTFLFILFAFVFLLSFRGQGGVNIERYVDMVMAGTNSFNDLCDYLFMTTPLLCRAMGEGNIWFLLAGLAVTAVCYFVMILLAKGLYQSGLYTASCVGAGKKHRKTNEYKPIQRNTLATMIIKECRILMRTMSYRTNCVYANLIWPVLSVVFFALSTRNMNVLKFTALYRGGQPFTRIMVLILVLAVSFVASGLNSIASTSFTREGAHIDVIRYLPVPIITTIRAKAFAAMIFTGIPLSLSIIAACISLGSSPATTALYLGLSLLSVHIATFVGICMDSISPYTVWADEATALRGNMNTFFNLAAGMLIAAIVCGICYLVYLWTGSETVCRTILTVILLVLSIAAELFSYSFVQKMQEKM